ncbi:hypothetical protein [Streptomyces sp. NPDC007905]|uniref:hypothetical protein n=1 Tax=Streptomyces sp. NPDC007905 TaxID=3364788 RepID=UPI0036E3D9F6
MRPRLPLSEGAESFEAAELQLSLVMCSPSTPAHWREIRSTPADRNPWGLEHLVFPTELIVGELVTNAARSGGAPVGLRLIRDQRLICEVSDLRR